MNFFQDIENRRQFLAKTGVGLGSIALALSAVFTEERPGFLLLASAAGIGLSWLRSRLSAAIRSTW